MIDALDDAEYSGSIISLIENGEAFIKRNNRVMWRKTDNSREEMPDGSLIQERDPFTVPSTRRNPVLADVLNRLGYMERKGSGLEKIISGYEFQINYDDSKTPKFRSDRYQFTVVMPNLNYNDTQDDTQGGIQDDTQKDLKLQIMDLIQNNNKISTETMAIVLGVSVSTIKRRIKEMENIHYVGSGFSGHWEISEED